MSQIKNLSKGDLMKLVFTKEELRNVDSAIPVELWKELDTSIHVVDYNIGGKIVNLVEKYGAMQLEKWKKEEEEVILKNERKIMLDLIAHEDYKKQIDPDASEFECFFHYTDEMIFAAGVQRGFELAKKL